MSPREQVRRPVLGIDLGTTNSTVASVLGGTTSLLQDAHGQVLFPSVVTLGEGDRLWIGREAQALGAAMPGRTAYAVKRLIGRWYRDEVVQRARQFYPYRILENPAGGGVHIQLGDQRYTPEQISGLVLRELKDAFNRQHGIQADEAVITVPAYFNHAQREGTQRAAAEAGLKVLRLLNEPTAAALSLPGQASGERVVAVYDFGGGTFDVSIIRIAGTVYEVLATDGDTFLGGDDIDGLLCDELARGFERDTGVKLRHFPLAWYRLRDAAEKAKKELSHSPTCSVFLSRLVEEHAMAAELSQAQLERLARPLIDRSLDICARTLSAAGITKDRLDALLLVGGQTRMPLIRRRVVEFFEREPSSGVDPDTAVAEGAAREGAMLRQGSGALLLDVTPITLGINIAGNRMYPIVPRNAKVPTSHTHVFTTHRDQQTRARMVILQGDHPLASDNTRLGEVMLTKLRGYERFNARIQVRFDIDANGILKISAVDQDTGESQALTIRDSFNPEGREPAEALEDEDTLAPTQETERVNIAGPFRATELVDVLYFLHTNHKTGRMSLSGGFGRGDLWLLDGQITHARLDPLRGLEAAQKLITAEGGDYAFHEDDIPLGPPELATAFEDLVRLREQA
jgi:molecular chaperone DnaK